MTIKEINSFLELGYLPKVSNKFLNPLIDDISHFKNLRSFYSKKNEAFLIREGAALLDSITTDFLSHTNKKYHLLPLSGGYDSRLILGLLLDKISYKDINTVTFGTPDTHDFELPKAVAKITLVNHDLIDLSKLIVTENDLLYALEKNCFGTELITAYYNKMILKKYGNNFQMWSGFFGVIAGNNYKYEYEKLSWDESLKEFVKNNQWVNKRKNLLIQNGFELINNLPQIPFIKDSSVLTYYEQLDFTIKQHAWLEKVVCSVEDNYFSPLCHPKWIVFMLAIPKEFRINSRLYHGVFKYKYPQLFNLPLKNRPQAGFKREKNQLMHFRDSFWKLRRKLKSVLGLGPKDLEILKHNSGVNKNINYIDFSNAFRVREDFINLAKINLNELDQNNKIPWINASNFIKLHMKGIDDYSQEILLLLSLNFHLKNEKKFIKV